MGEFDKKEYYMKEFRAIVGRYFNLNNVPTSNRNKSISLRPIFKLLNEDYLEPTQR